MQKVSAADELETKLGFGLFSQGETRLGWLLTFASVSVFGDAILPEHVFLMWCFCDYFPGS